MVNGDISDINLKNNWYDDFNDTPPLDEVLSSKSKVRILKILFIEDNISISEITRRTDLSFLTCSTYLKDLTKKNILMEDLVGGIKLYRVKVQNPKALLLKNLFSFWEGHLNRDELLKIMQSVEYKCLLKS